MATTGRHAIAALSSLTLIVGSQAMAQDHSEKSRSRLEVGVVGSILPAAERGGLGARVAVKADGPFALEVELEWMDAARHLYLPDQIIWFYVLQATHELRAGGQHHPRLFATYGGSGWASRNATQTGLRTSFLPPIVPTIGFGAQWALASRAALRADGQVILLFGDDAGFATPRFTVGVSVPIHLTRNRSD